jgi:excisionase family DNA binding protein
MEKKFLRINELVQYLGMKKSNLYSKVERKEIPFYRWGRLIIFKKDEIDAYMERCRVESGPVEKEAKRAARSTRKGKLDVDGIIKRAIESPKRNEYTSHHGKPDRIRGLRKEVKDGSI